MKKDIKENEKLVSDDEIEALAKIFLEPFNNQGFEFKEIDKRIDRESYPECLSRFVDDGFDFCKKQQFTIKDVLRITKLNRHQFRQWLHREQITLYSAKKQGSGKHLRFSIIDILIIVLARSLVNIKAPIPLTDQIKGGVLNRLKSIVKREHEPGIYRIQLNFLPGLQKWKATQSFSEGSPDEEINMEAFIVINVDRLIYNCLSDIDYFISLKELDENQEFQKACKTLFTDN